MEKKITISLGGKSLVLNFGIGRFYHLFKESTGFDILTASEGFDASKLFEVTQGLVYAGYYAECKLNKVQPEFTKDEIFDLVMDSDTGTVTNIFSGYSDSIKKEVDDTPGEAPGQPSP